jgi:hypothetical protein
MENWLEHGIPFSQMCHCLALEQDDILKEKLFCDLALPTINVSSRVYDLISTDKSQEHSLKNTEEKYLDSRPDILRVIIMIAKMEMIYCSL